MAGGCLWDVATGGEIRCLGDQNRKIHSVAFSANGQLTVTGGADGTARVWDVVTGREIKRFVSSPDYSAVPSAITRVAFSADSCFLVTNSGGLTTSVWEIATGKEIQRFDHDSVEEEAFSPNGQFVLTVNAQDHSELRLWDRTTGKRVQRFKILSPKMGTRVWINAVAFSPDGQFIVASTRSDTTVYLWEIATGREVRRFDKHTGSLLDVTFSSDGRFLVTLEGKATGGVGGAEIYGSVGTSLVPLEGKKKDAKLSLTGHFWDIATGEEVRRVEQPITGRIENATIASAERVIVVASAIKEPSVTQLSLLDLTTSHERQRIESVAANVAFIAMSPDGRFALTGSDNEDLRLWDVSSGQVAYRFAEHIDFAKSVAFSPDSRFIITTGYETYNGPADYRFHDFARLWDTTTGQEVRRFVGHTDEVSRVAFSPDGRFVMTGGKDNTARLWEAASGREVRRFLHSFPVTGVALSPDGQSVLTTDYYTIRLWNLTTGNEVWNVRRAWSENPGDSFGDFERFSRDGRLLMTRWGRTVYVLHATTGQKVRSFEYTSYDDIIGLMPDGRFVLRKKETATLAFWDLTAEKEMQSFRGIASANVSPDGRFIFTRSGGATHVWKTATGQELCQLISFRDGTWVVVDPEGRFDTNNLDNNRGLHWIMPDDPLTPLPLEIFMRDYYEPRLLPRILAGEKFRPVRALSELNRVQPAVKITKIEPVPNAPDVVSVSVEVAKARREFQRGAQKVVDETGVYDLRVFRDGQLVGYAPTTEGELPVDSQTKSAIQTFTVRLPRSKGRRQIEFSAYAFNVDRVKSRTDRRVFTLPAARPSVKGRAYLLNIGVNAYENPAWNLRFAANDARQMQRLLLDRLQRTGAFEAVIPILLTSDAQEDAQERKRNEQLATKDTIHAVFNLLAGKQVDRAHQQKVTNSDRLQPVKPEDLVLITFSSHGYADANGSFYLFPFDVGPGERKTVTPELLRHAISSDELSQWLRDIDAGQLVLIVDACHSAASVEGEGFKPGPMGSRGLGQLAYDKGMRILTASQADDVAIESGLLQQGLLTYALIQDGLEARRADFQPKDRRITLTEWLRYGAERVPGLYTEVRNGQLQRFGKSERARAAVAEYASPSSSPQRSGLQHPALFDFARRPDEILLTRAQAK
jgi:WD40 repeat protein/uncharacterized caspase-like protein